MKCGACGEPMVSARENFHYKASGLPVTLVGVEVRRCKACGEHEVVIPRIELLHREIARAVVRKRSRLTFAEIRYLRTYLGWSGTDFAMHMGVTPETVSRWENNLRMGPVADRLLRLMVQTFAPVADYSLDSLSELTDEATPVRLRVEASNGGWRADAVAA